MVVCRELSKWKIRPAGSTGRVVAEGPSDGDVPRLFLPHRHGPSVGRAYRDAVHARVNGGWSAAGVRQLHEVLCGMRSVRSGLADGERVPEWLMLTNFHAHHILGFVCKRQHDLLEGAPPEMLVPLHSPMACNCTMMLRWIRSTS